MLLDLLVIAIWIMLPAYMANNCATLLGGGQPLDMGRTFVDGKRILGEHKTVNGFVLGTMGGIVVALAQVIVSPWLAPLASQVVPGSPFLDIPPAAMVALPLGALLGDAAKSFAKRRIGIASGARWPVADQLDFVLGAWAICFLASPGWFAETFSLPVMAIIIVMTFPLQYFHNTIAVWLGKKKVRW